MRLKPHIHTVGVLTLLRNLQSCRSLSADSVCARYDITKRTLQRWAESFRFAGYNVRMEAGRIIYKD